MQALGFFPFCLSVEIGGRDLFPKFTNVTRVISTNLVSSLPLYKRDTSDCLLINSVS